MNKNKRQVFFRPLNDRSPDQEDPLATNEHVWNIFLPRISAHKSEHIKKPNKPTKMSLPWLHCSREDFLIVQEALLSAPFLVVKV